MHVLTVTCWKDRFQFLLQIYSIKKYLRGNFKHFIVINDDIIDRTEKNIKIWHSLINETYQDRIDYEIIFPEWDKDWGDCHYGWRSQQVYKFFFYDRILNDYVILDSKNFFIRPVNIENFIGMIGSGMTGIPSGNFSNINRVYANHFSCEILEDPLTPWTPFVVDYNVLCEYASPYILAKQLFSLSTEDPLWPSEFIFYSYLVKEKLSNVKPLVISSIPIFFAVGCSRKFTNIIDNPDIKIVSIHRRALSSMNKKHKIDFDSFLKYFDLPNFMK